MESDARPSHSKAARGVVTMTSIPALNDLRAGFCRGVRVSVGHTGEYRCASGSFHFWLYPFFGVRIMTRVVSFLAVAVIACGVSYGQKPGPGSEHLQCFRPFIGTWIYEGPL